MAQIAARAGVALSTVSYVLSGKRTVSPEIRERVLAAVAELDYRPHRPARALASGASHTIALFLPSPQWQLIPIQQTFVAGVTKETSASDYGLLLSTSPADPETIASVVEMGRADGVILMETLAHDRRIERLKAGGDPFTLIGRTADTTGISFVDIDTGTAVEKSLAHLAELGHRCVSLFNFPQDQLDAGYNAALIARDVFEEATGALGIRGIHLPCPHPAHEAFAIAAGLLRTDTGLHCGDHDRLAVHGSAASAASGRHARPRRLLSRLGDRGAVRGDADARAHRRSSGRRSRPAASPPRC